MEQKIKKINNKVVKGNIHGGMTLEEAEWFVGDGKYSFQCVDDACTCGASILTLYVEYLPKEKTLIAYQDN